MKTYKSIDANFDEVANVCHVCETEGPRISAHSFTASVHVPEGWQRGLIRRLQVDLCPKCKQSPPERFVPYKKSKWDKAE